MRKLTSRPNQAKRYNGSTVKTRVPAQVKSELRAIAEEEGLALSDIVRQAVRRFVAKHDAG